MTTIAHSGTREELSADVWAVTDVTEDMAEVMEDEVAGMKVQSETGYDMTNNVICV